MLQILLTLFVLILENVISKIRLFLLFVFTAKSIKITKIKIKLRNRISPRRGQVYMCIT
jgi:hypothetical protein